MPGTGDTMEKNQPCLGCTRFVNGDMLCGVRQKSLPGRVREETSGKRRVNWIREGPKKGRWGSVGGAEN